MTPRFTISNQFPLNLDLNLEAYLKKNRPSKIRRNITTCTSESLHYLNYLCPSFIFKDHVTNAHHLQPTLFSSNTQSSSFYRDHCHVSREQGHPSVCLQLLTWLQTCSDLKCDVTHVPSDRSASSLRCRVSECPTQVVDIVISEYCLGQETLAL